MYKVNTQDGKYSFTVTKHSRGNYNVWCLSEFSLPDKHGVFMRAKLIAQFGNTKNKENYIYARACANALCDAWERA